jgi:hypothetical protein
MDLGGTSSVQELLRTLERQQGEHERLLQQIKEIFAQILRLLAPQDQLIEQAVDDALEDLDFLIEETLDDLGPYLRES